MPAWVDEVGCCSENSRSLLCSPALLLALLKLNLKLIYFETEVIVNENWVKCPDEYNSIRFIQNFVLVFKMLKNLEQYCFSLW